MRPITSFALHAFAAAVLTAFAATSAAAQYLALGDSIPPGPSSAKGGKEKWIEIQGWDWGRTTKVDSFTIKQGIKPGGKDGAKGGNVEYGWKVEAGEKAPPPPGDLTLKGSKISENARESGEKGGTEDINIGVGELQEARPSGGVRVAAGDVDGDGRAATGTAIGKAIGNAATDGDDSAAQATGKRQHKPIRTRADADQGAMPTEKRQHGWVTVSKPLDRGSVRVKVKFPWLDCAVGARYPVITLGDGARSYRLQDVTVASCGSAAGPGDEGPEESITFVYGKLG